MLNVENITKKHVQFTFLLLIGLSLILALPWIGFLSLQGQYHGLEVNREAADFTLENTGGQFIKLSELVEKPTFITFGYQHCTNSCPVQWATLASLSTLIKNQAHFVWVSLDPEKDRSSRQQVNPLIQHLLPESNKVSQQLARQFRVNSQRVKPENNLNYIAHNDYIYLIDTSQKIRVMYQGSKASPKDIKTDLETLLRNR